MNFTLDNNCLIAVDRNEPAATFIRQLVAAHVAGIATVSVLGISASERRPGGVYLQSIAEFHAWLDEMGLGGVNLYKPTGVWGMTFWDWSIYGSPESNALEEKIHQVMFPAAEFTWAVVAAAAGEALDSKNGPAYRRWRNYRCDVKGMASHIANGGDVFVTSDSDFLSKAPMLVALGAKSVLDPAAAVVLLP